MKFWGNFLTFAAFLALIAFVLIGLVGCGSAPSLPPPEPHVITVDVPRIVQRPCRDQRPPASEYPDTDDKLAAIEAGDYEGLSKAYRAGRDLRDARLAVDDVQIKGCAAEP